MRNEPSNSNQGRIGILKFWAWQSRSLATAVNFIVMSWLMFYATDTLGMPVVLVGTLLMVSRIADAFLNLPAGLLIDRTQTRFGKARPYEFAIIGMWLFTWLLFSIPGEASLVVQSVWFVLFYTLTSSVCGALLNTGNTAYMVRAFRTDEQRVRIVSLGGFVNMIFAMSISISFPILVSNFATSPERWSSVVLIFAVPLAVIGMLRFVFVKETVAAEDEGSARPNTKDVWNVLKSNPYLRLVALLWFVFSAINSMRAAQYFFEWVMGDIGLMSVVGIVGFAAIPLMLILPRIVKKFSKRTIVIFASCMYIIGGTIYFLGGSNISLHLVLVAAAFHAMAAIPIAIVADLILLDVGSYNAYKNGKRMDGTLVSVRNFLGLVGGAIAPGLLGILLGISGYDGTLYVQPDAAIFMIRAAMGLVPAVLFAIIAVVFAVFYKLDKQMPKIKVAIENKNEQE